MAILTFQVTSFGRGRGSCAPSLAAYRSGERLRDERRGQVFNHLGRRDVVHKDILVPSRMAREAPDWVRSRGELWNAAEAAETRANARVAREYMVALPHELDPEARVELARRMSMALVERYASVIDLTVHEPRPQGDPRNHHAHLLATTRELTPGGLGRKTPIELSDDRRRQLGLAPAREELFTLRELWATLTNAALREQGLDVSVDARSLRAQGIDRRPQAHLPMAVIQMERGGIRTELMAWELAARARDEERRAALSVEQTRPVQALEERRAQSRSAWRAYRALERDRQAAPDGPSRSGEFAMQSGEAHHRLHDTDLGLG